MTQAIRQARFWALCVKAALLACALMISPMSVMAPLAAGTSNGVSSRLNGDLGYLPLHPATYANAKAALEAGLATRTGRQADSPLLTTGPSWQGIYQSNVTPPDANGAIGPSRYVEMVNLQYAVYDRVGTLKARGSLQTLTNDFYISDPEVIWDPATQRFYYTMVDYIANTIKWGFSNSATPDSDGWCSYTANFGYSYLPDYPRLGDTQNFLLIGVNLFANFSIYEGSDVAFIQKPPGLGAAGSTCPSPFNPSTGHFHLTNSTPVPAVQTDPSPTGWVVAAPDVSSAGSIASTINVFQLTESSTGFSVTPTPVTVPSFSMPANAAQLGTNRKLDTLDGRLERAVAGLDPSHNSNMAVWTAHAVAQSASNPVAEERWYEIGVTSGLTRTAAVLQLGSATASGTSIWNGAISPDRAVSCSATTCSGTYGSDMVMTVNVSSASQYPAIEMVSREGSSPQSGFTLVQSSAGYDADFSCRNANSVCRWGDYSGASPDPAATGSVGAVWLTNEWNVANSNLDRAAWRTLNWEVSP